MLIRLIVCLLFFTSITTGASAKTLKAGFTSKERRTALYLIELLRDSRITKKDHYLIRQINKEISSKNTFIKYKPSIDNISTLLSNPQVACTKITKQSHVRSPASEAEDESEEDISIENQDASDLILKRLDRIASYQCEKFILNSFLKKSKVTKEMVFSISPYIFKHRKAHKTLVKKALQKIRSNNSLSLILQNHIIQNQLTEIPNIVIQNIPKSLLLSSYLQSIGYDNHKTNSEYDFTLRKHHKSFKRLLSRKKYAKAVAQSKETINFFMANSKYFNNGKAWNIFRRMGTSLSHQGYYNDSLELFKLSELIAKPNQKSDSIFNILWVYMIQGKYEKAYKYVFEERIESKMHSYDKRLQFWIAKIYQENDFNIRANQIFASLIDSKSMNYYAILAKKELSLKDKAEAQRIVASLYQSKTNLIKPVTFTKNDIEALKRYRIFKRLKANRYAQNQLNLIFEEYENIALAAVEKVSKENSTSNLASVYYSVIQFLDSNNDFLTAFKVMYRALDREHFSLDENLLSILFPKNYEKTIQKLSQNFDPIVYLSLIRQESAFNPGAKSRVGARGLMQIMPRTARQYYSKLRASSLDRPALNLKIGIKYFRRLAKKYKGNLVYTLAAYNAGEGRVKKWKKNIFKSTNPLLNVESIPFSETQNYVKLIYRNIFYYQYLNDNNNALSEISKSFQIPTLKKI